MSRFHLSLGKTRRLCLFVMLALTLVLTALPTAAQAAPAAGNYDRDWGRGCGDCYIVRKGDTLSQIAKWYGVNVWALARYNGIDNPSVIYVGQRIRIPSRDCGGCDYDHGRGNDDGCGGCGYDHGRGNDDGCGGCGYDGGYGHDNGCGHDGGCGYDGGYGHDNGCGHDGGCGYDGGYGHGGYDGGYGHGGYSDAGYGRHDGYGYGDDYYVVRRGDTLSEIARRCGVSIHKLMYLNGISNPNQIYVGQVLVLG